MAGEKILVVDDDPDISDVLSLYLTKNGFEVLTAEDGFRAVELAKAAKPDLILLDVLLPGLDGLEVCQELRKEKNIPILFLSCKSEEIDKILGLSVGGDDYITKPFSPGEVIARVKAHLRRHRVLSTNQEPQNSILAFPGLVIDLNSHSVLMDGSSVDLSAKEFQLLAMLAQNPNTVFSIEKLFRSVWSSHSFGDNRTVMVHMSNLRRKIEKDPSDPKYVVTIKGAGYKFNLPVSSL